MTTLAQPQFALPRWHVPKLVAMLLGFAAAVLAVVSSFLPLLSARLSAGTLNDDVTINGWTMTSTAGATGEVPANGYPLVFGALFLTVAAVVAWYAASPSTTPGIHRMAGLLTSIGAAFLLGTAWTVSGQTVSDIDSVISAGNQFPGIATEASYDAGFWLLLVAGLLALTAAVMALLPVRQGVMPPPPPGSYLANAPVVHQLPPEPQPQPHFLVDPLTGQPLGQQPSGHQFAGNGFPPVASNPGPPTNPSGFPRPEITAAAPEQPPGPAVPAAEDPLTEPKQP